VERILNKIKVKGAEKYLVQWKGFMAENDTWEKEEDLENAKELVDEFEGRLNAEVRQQERKEYKRSELLGNIWQGCCMDRTMENSRQNI